MKDISQSELEIIHEEVLDKTHAALMMLMCYYRMMNDEEREIIYNLEKKIIDKYTKIDD